jgi:hypothetical protein
MSTATSDRTSKVGFRHKEVACFRFNGNVSLGKRGGHLVELNARLPESSLKSELSWGLTLPLETFGDAFRHLPEGIVFAG